jgi:cytochrome c
MTVRRRLAALLTVVIVASGPVRAETADAAHGREIAEANCGRCHALGRTGDSPLAKAPPFRDLGKRYPVEQLAEALAEGIMTGHAEMPEFAFEPDEVGALLAFLEELTGGDKGTGKQR